MSRFASIPLLKLSIFCLLVADCISPPSPDKYEREREEEDDGDQNQDHHGPQHRDHDDEHEHDGPRGHHHRKNDHDDDDGVTTIKATCQNRGNCQGQSDEAKQTRDAVKCSLTRDRDDDEPGDSDDDVERRFQKTWEAKKAVFQLKGLPDLDPHDNGLFAGDMLLNEEQADRIINRTKGILETNDTNDVPLLDVNSLSMTQLNGTGSSNSRRKRGDILALDYYVGNKWPSTTINFYINPKNFSALEGNIIRAALKSISDSTCLQFIENWTYPVIEYVKAPDNTGSGTCGWAPVGHQGNYNAVNINFNSTLCIPTLQGVVVHETLHVLGFAHEHTRYDRDRYLKIDWTNVDPQSYDIFHKDDPHDYNPYCAPFDLLSIMHYDPYVGALDSKKPAMTSLLYSDYYLSRMGRGIAMTTADIELLKKMYCQSSTCKDKSTNCGWTACTDCVKYALVCQKSCGKC